MLRAAVFLLTISPIISFAQLPDRRAQAAAVKDAVGVIAGSGGGKAEVVLRDLREFEGKIVGLYDDHFVIRPKQKGRKPIISVTIIGHPPPGPPPVRIYYRDVLQIEGKQTAVSFVPDPAASPYSSWDEVAALGRGEFLQVHMADGRKIHGVYYPSTADSISLMRGDRETVISSGQVARLYRVVGDTRSLATKIVTGGTRGTQISEELFPIFDPKSIAHPVANVIGAAIGTTIYILPLGKTKRVLVFSR
jgi:hypothetical protein